MSELRCYACLECRKGSSLWACTAACDAGLGSCGSASLLDDLGSWMCRGDSISGFVFSLVAGRWGSFCPWRSVAFWAGLPGWSHLECGTEAGSVFGSHLEGSGILLAPCLFSRLHFPGFWWGKHDPKRDLLVAPQGDTDQFIVFSMWLAHLRMFYCSARKEFTANKHNRFSSLASSCFQTR